MPNLLPDGYELEVIDQDEVTEKEAIGYKNSSYFNYNVGDFAVDGNHCILDCDGIEGWKSWCINCMSTQRYKHMGYSTDFGIEYDKAFRAKSRGESESILTRQITEAIMADDYCRCAYVDNIEYNWTGPDSVEIKVTLHGIDGTTVDTTVNITKGGVSF